MAGIFGKKEGYGQGRCMVGSHMQSDPAHGLMPNPGSLGAASAVTTGAALAIKLQGRPNAVLCTQGDGASSRGDNHESMNFASVLKLPVVFFFINNGWGATTRTSDALSVPRISDRAAAYGMRGVTVDGFDPVDVYTAVSDALERARHDREPSIVEVLVRRCAPHNFADPDIYRSDEDRERDRLYDPVGAFEKRMLEQRLLTESEVSEVRREVGDQIEAAVAYADSCTEPELADMLAAVYERAE
jgi:pyruvate dehydrogenase E1 component alpha subunit